MKDVVTTTVEIRFPCGIKQRVKSECKLENVDSTVGNAVEILKYWHNDRHSERYKKYLEDHPDFLGVRTHTGPCPIT